MPVLNARRPDHNEFLSIATTPPPIMSFRRPNYLRSGAINAEAGSGTDTTVSVLSAANPILATLTEPARRELLRSSRIRQVKRREVVCRQGDLADAVVLVMDGFLKRTTPLPDGGEVLFEVIGPGSSVGELTVFQEQRHDADLTALSQCLLLRIDARQFRQTFDREPAGLLAIMRSSAGQLRRATEQLLDGRALSAGVRLAKALLYLSRFSSSACGAAAQLRVRLSQSELGALAGISREAVNKNLGAWRDSGWLGMSAGTVTWVETAALRDMLREDFLPGVAAAAFSRDRDNRRCPAATSVPDIAGPTRQSLRDVTQRTYAEAPGGYSGRDRS